MILKNVHVTLKISFHKSPFNKAQPTTIILFYAHRPLFQRNNVDDICMCIVKKICLLITNQEKDIINF